MSACEGASLESCTGDSTFGRRLGFLRQLALSQLADLPGLLRALPGPNREAPALQMRTPPDSALARAAMEFAREVYPSPLLEHCMRCWYLGDLFAQLDQLVYDPEQLYLACLLHDVGLTAAHPFPATVGCFAVHGSAVAEHRLAAWGVDDLDRTVVVDAIIHHMDARVPPSRAVAFLLHAGAHCDVVGSRADQLPADNLRTIHARHPRDRFGDTFRDAMRTEARLRPRSRAGIMWRNGAGLRIRLNPLDRWC